MKRILATFLLLAGLYCSSVFPSLATGNTSPGPALKMGGGYVAASEETPVWSGPKPHGPLKPFVLDMVGTPKKNDGTLDPETTFHDTLEKINWHGHKAMRRIVATTRPGETEFTRWATVVFDQKTQLPYYAELRIVEGPFIRREFDGVHVKETRTAGGFRKPSAPDAKLDTETAEYDLPEPAYAWFEGSGLLVLLALPLREGLEGSVPVISASATEVKPCFVGPCFAGRMSYHVVGKEEISGISGKQVLTWKISVPETHFFFWIACNHPRLEGVTWPRSAGAMTAGQADAVFSMGPIVKK